MSSLLSDVSGLFVTFLVPGVVWGTLAAGLYQLVRDEVRHVRVRQFHLTPPGSQRLEGYSHQVTS